MSIRQRFSSLVSSTRAPWFAALLALLLSLPSLAGGFAADDHGLAYSIAQGIPAWDAFNINNYGSPEQWREQGFMGWWAADELRIAFFRPISALTHWLDFQLWPEAAWAMHLGSAIIYALLVAMAGLLFQRVRLDEFDGLGAAAFAAGLAAVLFAIDEAHAQTLGWISSRNAVIAAVFGFAAVWAHHRWRREGWRAGVALGPMFFLASLLSTEGGLACGGYLLAHALFLDRESWKRGLLWLLPYATIVVVWRVLYDAMGYGAHATGLYLDLSRHPFDFLLQTVQNSFVLVLAQLTLPFSTQVATAPGGWVVAAVLLLLLSWLLWPLLKSDRVARFWALGMVAAAAPFGATIASDRVLIPLGLGASGLIAQLVVATREGSLTGRRIRWTGTGLLIFNAILAPLLFIPSLFGAVIFESLGQQVERVVPESEVTVVVNVPMDLIMLYPQSIREHGGGTWPENLYLLHSGVNALEIERVDEQTLELRPEGGWMVSPIDRVARSLDYPFEANDRVSLEEVQIDVLEVTGDGRPLRARFRFERDLGEISWIAWGEEGPAPWRPPEVGEQAELTAAITM